MSFAEELVQLSRDLGREDRHLAILGEGNTSCDLGDGSFLVKASGTSLGTLTTGLPTLRYSGIFMVEYPSSPDENAFGS